MTYELIKEYRNFNLYLNTENGQRECFDKGIDPEEVKKAKDDKAKIHIEAGKKNRGRRTGNQKNFIINPYKDHRMVELLEIGEKINEK